MKNNYKEIDKYEKSKDDEANKYDFYVKYYMNFAIGTKYEDCVEITKQDYDDLIKKINNTKKAMIKVFATYTVGF